VASLETGTLYNDDNLDRLGAIADESADLIYLLRPEKWAVVGALTCAFAAVGCSRFVE